MGNPVRCAVLFVCLQGVALGCFASADVLAQARQESATAMAVLQAQVDASQGDIAQRNRLILQIANAEQRPIAEHELQWLSDYRERQPQDHLAKLYEGYGWLLMAERYMRQQNHFRAAELAKRGFFLVDEAVDEQPQDWTARLLRARMDSALPAEFGRYVVALEDLELLRAESDVPRALRPLLSYLQFRALKTAGRDAEAQPLASRFAESAIWVVAERTQGASMSREEIDLVLSRVLERGHE